MSILHNYRLSDILHMIKIKIDISFESTTHASVTSTANPEDISSGLTTEPDESCKVPSPMSRPKADTCTLAGCMTSAGMLDGQPSLKVEQN